MEKTKNNRVSATILVLLLAISFAVTAIPSLISTSSAATDSGWTLVTDGRGMKVYADLREYVWQKNASMPPNGEYDKIGLHRLVKTGITPKGVVFINPGTYGNGEQLTSNPPSDNYTKYENNDIAIYWANRGFDVYAIDYRTHFVPISLNATQRIFMQNWGWDQWISDTKEAVNKAKDVSGASKVFMAGFSFGGFVTMNYATKYWQEDLRGIVLLDGGYANMNTNTTNTSNLTATNRSLNASGTWAYEYPNMPGRPTTSPGYLLLVQYAFQNPGAAAEYPPGTPLQPTINPMTNRTWANITEWATFSMNGTLSNTLGGYGNITVDLQFYATSDPYWPIEIYVEAGAYRDWINCPFVKYDFDDHYKEINVPLLGFSSESYAIPTFGNLTNGIANADFTSILLPKYGHRDVILGTYSARDVSQPVLDWMGSQLVGQKATAFCNVTVMGGWTWWFFAHSTGGIGPHTYQWYEGTTLLQGQTSMVLPVTKTSPGTYTFYCKVTGSEGTTTNSNPVTLTVFG